MCLFYSIYCFSVYTGGPKMNWGWSKQGSHSTGKTGKNNPRQGNHREFESFWKAQGKCREFENLRDQVKLKKIQADKMAFLADSLRLKIQLLSLSWEITQGKLRKCRKFYFPRWVGTMINCTANVNCQWLCNRLASFGLRPGPVFTNILILKIVLFLEFS